MSVYDPVFAAAVMAGPNLDNVTDPDVIGQYGLEWDGDRCQGDDCQRPVDDDVKLCDDCDEDLTCGFCGGVGTIDDGDRLCPIGCWRGVA